MPTDYLITKDKLVLSVSNKGFITIYDEDLNNKQIVSFSPASTTPLIVDNSLYWATNSFLYVMSFSNLKTCRIQPTEAPIINSVYYGDYIYTVDANGNIMKFSLRGSDVDKINIPSSDKGKMFFLKNLIVTSENAICSII